MQRVDSGQIIVLPFSQNDCVIWAKFGPGLLHWIKVSICVLFWFILWLLRFSEAHFGSPSVELFKALFWFISAQVWLKIMARFTFWLER